ncbi:MAG: glycosyltransferase family 4 protein [Formivibrio sp.]|nr:glycosyltransferase family 4 protein [Formivibrio sp.]
MNANQPAGGFSLAYCTNIWNHYQAPVCTEFSKSLGNDAFNLCLFEPVHEERRQLGWGNDIPDYRWIKGPPTSKNDFERLNQIVCNADVAVLGACPQKVQAARAATGKLTFIMSERLWKQPFAWWRMLNPRYARGVRRYKQVANLTNVHYLPIGAYAAGDARRIKAYGDRMWTWAYFADVTPHPPSPRTNTPINILWVGRMLDWKRVDLLLKAVARVCNQPAFGRLDMVGTGSEKARLQKLARNLSLNTKCFFHEPVSPDRIREFMRQADVYVLPSNRYEGWGVVANEAMSEGAVLVANDQAGAAPVLIEHGRTGFLFPDGDVGRLSAILQTVLADAALREKISYAAWQEMQRLWNPRVGAERLVGLCRGLLGLAPMPEYHGGPCCLLK